MQHGQFYLDAGSHKTLTKSKKVCVLEASIAAAGFEYREIHCAGHCPECYSRTLATDLIHLNDLMPPRLRQELLTPFIMKLPGTADSRTMEFSRAEYIVKETCQRIMPLYLDDEGYPVFCKHLRTANTLREAHSILLDFRDRVEGNFPNTPSSRAAAACDYFCGYAVPNEAVAEAAYAVHLACGRSRKGQDKYFLVATRILDEAIGLATRRRPEHRHAALRMPLPA
jgi:hypothetical protein